VASPGQVKEVGRAAALGTRSHCAAVRPGATRGSGCAQTTGQQTGCL